MITVTKKNHEKLRKYNELLWNVCYATNYLDSTTREETIFNKVLDSAWNEYHSLDKELCPWNEKVLKTIDNSKIKVGDYFKKVYIRDKVSYSEEKTVKLIHILDIHEELQFGQKKNIVYYESITIENGYIYVHGENLEDSKYARNESQCLEPLVLDLMDNVITKIDESEWNSVYEQYKIINKIYKNLI